MVASPFYAYQTPSIENYAFFGSCCFLLFCIKLLYVDDSPTLAKDHALLVNWLAAFFFTMGQLALLLSLTVLGSGLELLTHSYLAATTALPTNAKQLVCGGFSAVVLSIFFIKSLHVRRIPSRGNQQWLFVGAFAIQTIVMLLVVVFSMALFFGYFEILVGNEISMMFCLSAVEFILLIICWLDEAVELSLYKSSEDSRQFMVQPIGFWWCQHTEERVETEEEEEAAIRDEAERPARLSSLSPLLGNSVANMQISQRTLDYASMHDAVV